MNAIRKVLLLFLSILFVSVLLSYLCWHWFGYEYHLWESGVLEINFFATVCNFFTIIGLAMTVFQVSKLESDQIIRDKALEDIRQQDYKTNSLVKCGYIKRVLESLNDRMETDVNISRNTVTDYGYEINRAYSYLQSMLQRQGGLTKGILIDGKKALILLEQMEQELIAMDETTIKNFPRSRHQLHIQKVLLEFESCENMLKS
jgi:hypothetical protein